MIPGIPSTPAAAAVIAFMGKKIPKFSNMASNVSKIIPPSKLLSNNFPISFSGISNNFPKKNTNKMPQAYARKIPASILKSINPPPKK